jgi:hypothetical protein
MDEVFDTVPIPAGTFMMGSEGGKGRKATSSSEAGRI